MDEKGLRQVTDTSAIDAAVDSVLAANPDKVAEYKSGREKLFGFFGAFQVEVMLANDRLGIAGLESGIAHRPEFPDVHADEAMPQNIVGEVELLAEL